MSIKHCRSLPSVLSDFEIKKIKYELTIQFRLHVRHYPREGGHVV